MAATKAQLDLIFRQLFVRNMSAEDAAEASTRFLDLYFTEVSVDMSDTNIHALNLKSDGNCNAVTVNATTVIGTTSLNTATVNATTAVNSVVVRGSTSVNTATLNATTAVNSIVGNITDVRATNTNSTVGNITTVAATNVTATSNIICNTFTSNLDAGVANLTATSNIICNTFTSNLNANGVAGTFSANFQANNLIATNFANCVTLDAATSVNTPVGYIVDVRATNVNSTVVEAIDGRFANCNATIGNITDIKSANCNSTNIRTSYATFKTDKHTLTNVTGATCVQVDAITAGSFVIGVTADITANVAGATSINVGDGSDDDEFGVLAAVVDGTNFSWATLAPYVAATSTNIVLTAVGGATEFDGNGNVDIYVTYIKPDGF